MADIARATTVEILPDAKFRGERIPVICMLGFVQQFKGVDTALRAIVIFVCICGVVVTAGCSKERGADPVYPRSRVYVTLETNPPPPTLLIFDVESDSLIDSLRPPVNAFTTVVNCDPSQPRFAISQSQNVVLYSDGGSSQLGPVPTRSVEFAYYPKADELVGFSGTYGGVISPILEVFDANNLTIKFQDTISLATSVVVDNRNGLVYGISYFEATPGAFPSRAILCAYDIPNRRFHDCWPVEDSISHAEHYVWRFAISPDGRYGYLLTTLPTGTWLVGVELLTKRILFESAEYEPAGVPQVTPDGSEIWLPVGNDGPPTLVDRIRIYDSRLGELLSTIDLHNLRLGPLIPVKPREVRFTPDGKRAYVMCGQFGGPILLIDTESHEVLKAWYTDNTTPRTHRPLSMDIGPAQ